ncbi:hypothetical protein FH972_018651 [Carpinus fangiana]|uniref:Uncharacterized protein n=1 Tax=Carpinus fangiana TaxID=176857 RepID=A0A5N6RMZ5_9ROSI|nr:hypothetical protein FH972_018651 [Carpinus fangiana]
MGSDGFHRMGFAGICVNGFCRGLLCGIRGVNGCRRNTKGAALRTPGSIPEKKSNMDLDEQIAQLMECKPLVEQQVPL